MIEVENLHFRYPSGVEALKGVSLVIKNGEFAGLDSLADLALAVS